MFAELFCLMLIAQVNLLDFSVLCPFEHSTVERFCACRAISSGANLGCFSALQFAEAGPAEAGYAEVLLHLSRCCRGSLSEARIYAEFFCMRGAFHK